MTKNNAAATTVMIDGYNLALETGTGVATYARNLSYACRDLGYRTEILYGRSIGRRRSSLLTEVSFFDTEFPPDWIDKIIDEIKRHIPRPLGMGSFPIPVTGDVMLRSLQSRMPHFDRLRNARDVFSTAARSFDLWSNLTKVRNPGPVGIMHWTYPFPLRMSGARNIYTLHDLVPLRLPYTTLDKKSSYLRLTRKLVKRADHIVTVSETSRADIIKLLGCPPEKVTNTYQSVTIPKPYLDKPVEAIQAEVEGAFGLPYKGYLLFYGAIEPKKNVGRLIEAYLASGVETPLLIIGSRAWKSDQELRLMDTAVSRSLQRAYEGRATAADRIHHFNYAPFPLLVSAIRGAKATLFPSLYEGFGLPVLESMLLGTPVLTSREGATREIAGEAAVLVDPYNPREIASAIHQIDRDQGLRAKLIFHGQARAAQFSPERHQERLSILYESLYRRP